MRNTPTIRKITAIGFGIIATLLIHLIFQSTLFGILFISLGDKVTSTKTETIFGNWFFDNSINTFYQLLEYGISLTLGLITAFIIWDFKDKYRRRLFIYFPLLILVGGFSLYNYFNFDRLIRPDVQVIFNLLLLFLGLVCSLRLWKFKAEYQDGMVLKYFIIFLLLVCTVFIPFLFSVCWFIKRIGFADFNFNFNIPVLTTITSIITATITLLKYKDDKRKAEKTEK